MGKAFDSYHIWLGIPPEDQPPNHYRLLGLMPFESNPDAIQNAADRQMIHLRTFQTGKHSEYSQRLLNEVAAAKICLLNGPKKSAYDAQLRASIEGRPPSLAAQGQEDDPPEAAMTFLADDAGSRYQHTLADLRKKRTRNSRMAMMAGASAAAVLAALAIYYMQSASGERRTASLQAAALKQAEESSGVQDSGRKEAAPATESKAPPSTPRPSDPPPAPPVEPDYPPPIELVEQTSRKPVEPPPSKYKLDWTRLSTTSARVQSLTSDPIILTESTRNNGWQRVPDAFKRHHAVVYMEKDSYYGVVDFEVVQDGALFLACDFGYQGNPSGDWIEKRWTKEQFINNGWTEVPQDQLGGVLVDSHGGEHVVFMKQVERGEKYRLRCNKYRPPRVIVFNVLAGDPRRSAALNSDRETASFGEQIRVFKGHHKTVYSVAFSPDGRRALTGSVDRTAILWDVDSGEQVQLFKGHNDFVSSVAFSPDGERVLTAAGDRTAIIWDTDSGNRIHAFNGHGGIVTSGAFSPDGKKVLTGSRDDTVILWDVDSGQQVRVFKGHSQDVTTVAFSPNGKQALTGSDDHTAILWDVDSGEQIRAFKGHDRPIYSVAFNQDGRRALTGSWDRTAILWDVSTGKQIRVFNECNYSVTSVVFSPDGRRVLTGLSNSTAILWDAETGNQLHVFKGHNQGVVSVAFSPNGKQVLTGSLDNTAILWDADASKSAADADSPPPIELEVQPPDKPAVPPPEDKETTPSGHDPPSKPPVEDYAQGGRLLAVPGEEEQERAMILARSLFADELAKAETPEQKSAAADKILSRAKKIVNDPVGAFVLYQLACETAVQAGDCGKAFQALDSMAKRYRIDAVEKKTAVLKELTQKTRSPADHASLAERALDVMDIAVCGDKCAQAVEAGEFALSEAVKSRDKELLAAVRPRVYEVRKTAQKFVEFEAARAVLAENQDDPKANQTAGEYLCFFKGVWDLGLHYLAKGADAELTTLARRELKSPAETAEQAKLADDWWNYAHKTKAPVKEAVQLHAGLWYRKARGKAVGLAKAAIEKRLEELAKIAFQNSLAGGPRRSAAINADVLIKLGAESAEFRRSGGSSRIGLRSHYGNVNIPHIENWYNPQDGVFWNKVKFPKRGVYEVAAQVATIHDGSELVVGIKDGYGACGTIPNTHGYGNFRNFILGTIKIERPGEYQIFAGPFPPKASTWKPINLAGITLKYVSPSNAAAASKRSRRKPVSGKITASCDDDFELCVNGAQVLVGRHYQHVPVTVHEFAKGDVITVKCVNTGGARGFTCVIQFQNGRTIVSGDGWKEYMPKDAAIQWHDPKNIGQTIPAVPGNSGSRGDVQKVCGVGAWEIWGSADTCYLFYVIP